MRTWLFHTQPPPYLSVGLPLYAMGHIAWLALEGLCRQQHAAPWELIVVEEQFHNPLGIRDLKAYHERLAAAGCVAVTYKGLSRWNNLAAKWAIITQQAHPESVALVLQGGDDHPHPHRLAYTAEAMRTGVQWYHEEVGLFYDRDTRTMAEYRHPDGATTALNMAVRLELVRQLPARAKRRGTDRWLHQCATRVNGAPLRHQLRNHMQLGLFTCGWNHLSTQRGALVATCANHYHPTLRTLPQVLPDELAQRLMHQ